MHYEIMLEVDKTIGGSFSGAKKIYIERFDPALHRPDSAQYHFDRMYAVDDKHVGIMVGGDRYRDGCRTFCGMEETPQNPFLEHDARLKEFYDEIFELLPLFKKTTSISRQTNKDVFMIRNEQLSPAVRDKIESIFHDFGFSNYEDVKHHAGYRSRY